MQILLKDALPRFASELEHLLLSGGHIVLAQQVPELAIVDRCRCGDDFCATFYTQPKPEGRYGPGHDSLDIDPEQGMIVVDTVEGRIAKVEVLNRDDVRNDLFAVMP